MNRICKQYIEDVKSLFPLIGKDERKYINKLKTEIEDFFDDSRLNAKEDLYKSYALPTDVVNNYYSTISTEDLIKKIRISKYIKRFLIVLTAVVLIIISILSTMFVLDHQITSRQEVIITEEIIEWKEKIWKSISHFL